MFHPAPSEDPKGFDPRDPQEDLKRLIAKQERVALKEKEGRLTKSDAVEDDIPPLIQAITRYRLICVREIFIFTKINGKQSLSCSSDEKSRTKEFDN